MIFNKDYTEEEIAKMVKEEKIKEEAREYYEYHNEDIEIEEDEE